MKKFTLLSACAMLAMASPAVALDTTTADTGPVKVTSCTVQSSSINSVLVQGVSRTDGVTVAFINQSDKPAADVTITGTYNGISVTDTLKGPFAPGSTMMVTKTYNPTIFVGPNANCHVTHVTFADGTTWSLPAK